MTMNGPFSSFMVVITLASDSTGSIVDDIEFLETVQSFIRA